MVNHSAAPAAGVVRVAAVQMTSGADRDENIARAGELVERAVADGADLVVLPEKWNLMDDRAGTLAGAEDLDGPSLEAVRGWAVRLGVAIVAGSVNERHDGRTVRNASVAVDERGDVAGVYRKIHLFDVDAGGRVYRESDEATPGDFVVTATLAGIRVGMSICYDLRFPELYRALADRGADAVVVPAAFTAATGPPHWEVLLRARAIENQCAVIAAGQVGAHPHGVRTHGHSMIVDAWGVVRAEAATGAGPCVVVADVDLAEQRSVRERLPALRHRRLGRDHTAGGWTPPPGRT